MDSLNDPAPKTHRGRWLLPLALFIATLGLIAVTSKDYGITWDEPAYFEAADLHIEWLHAFARNLVAGKESRSLDDGAITTAWHGNPYYVPHPPFSRLVSGLSKALLAQWLGDFSAYRIGPALFFAVLVAAMFVWLRELFGTAAGIFSALALLLIPNLFGYAHLAVTDLPLAALWFLTVYCFWKGLFNWKWSVVLGVVWGLALATKFPALLIPIPLILWAHFFHRDKYANNLFALIFVAPVIMVAVQPYLWHQTGLRVLEFLYEGLSRAYRPDANFMIYFFHRLYFTAQLPWYYSLFMIGVTTPEPLLLLALLGMACIALRKVQRAALLLLLSNAAFILALGWMPGAVLHDGVRQMLSVLPFIAALAGAGFHFLLEYLLASLRRYSAAAPTRWLPAKIAGILILLFSFSPLLDVYLCHPFQLSFYNRLVGGVRGAHARGLEMTYFMEALTPDFLRELNDKLPRGATVNGSIANFMLAFYQKSGALRPDLQVTASQTPDYYVLLNRRSVLGPRERALLDAPIRPFLGVELAGVPLVSVFALKPPASRAAWRIEPRGERLSAAPSGQDLPTASGPFAGSLFSAKPHWQAKTK